MKFHASFEVLCVVANSHIYIVEKHSVIFDSDKCTAVGRKVMYVLLCSYGHMCCVYCVVNCYTLRMLSINSGPVEGLWLQL